MKREGWLAAAATVLVTLGVVVGFWYFHSPESTKIKVGMQAPDLELSSVGSAGVKTRLSRFRGRPVLLVMYMAGCKSCEKDLYAVERLNREFLQKGLVVLGVAVDADPAKREDFIRRHEITFVVLEDTNGQAAREAYGSWQMPEAYLIDPSGVVDAVYLGSVNWRSPEVRERIERLLPKVPPRKQP